MDDVCFGLKNEAGVTQTDSFSKKFFACVLASLLKWVNQNEFDAFLLFAFVSERFLTFTNHSKLKRNSYFINNLSFHSLSP